MTSLPDNASHKDREGLDSQVQVCAYASTTAFCAAESFSPTRTSEHFSRIRHGRIRSSGRCSNLSGSWNDGESTRFLNRRILQIPAFHTLPLSSVCDGKPVGFLTWTAVSPGGIYRRGTLQSMANSNGFITVILWTASGQLLRSITLPLSSLCL